MSDDPDGHRHRRGGRTTIRGTCRHLVADGFASRLAAQDATLWGPDAESEAAKRLAWVGSPRSSRPLVAEIDALRAELWPAASTRSCSAAWAAPRWRRR